MIEYRDLYDQYQKLTGEVIGNNEIIPNGRYVISVILFIENDYNEFLLQKNDKLNVWTSLYGHPVAGESSLEYVVNKIKNELGYNVNPNKIKLIKTYKNADHFIEMYYLKENILLDLLTLQSEDNNINWFNKDEIDRLISIGKFLPNHLKYYKDCNIIVKGKDL